jgi:hypothetical protein
MKLPIWLALLISPRGIPRVADAWPTRAAVLVGFVTTGLILGLPLAAYCAGIAEPYVSTDACFTQIPFALLVAVPTAYLHLALLAGFLSSFFDKEFKLTAAYRAAWLGFAPVLIPLSAWFVLNQARAASDPGYNLDSLKPDWVYSPVVQVGGSSWVLLALTLYGIASWVFGVMQTRGNAARLPGGATNNA